MFFSHILPRVIRQQQDNGDDAHQEYDAQVEPQGLDMPAAKYLFTTIKRRAAQFVVWCQINDTAAGYQIVVDDFHHPWLVSASHKLLQFDILKLFFFTSRKASLPCFLMVLAIMASFLRV